MDRNPNKNMQLLKELVVPPSPKSLETMYDRTRVQHVALKTDVVELFCRFIAHCGKEFVSQVVLDEEPLLNAYDLYLEAINKTSVPVIVISDSTANASVNRSQGV